jgi:hypothetical protein
VKQKPRMVFLPEGRYYGIPYRSLLCREINNLLVTGRAISMDHGALALSSGQSIDAVDTGKLREMLAKDGARLK